MELIGKLGWLTCFILVIGTYIFLQGCGLKLPPKFMQRKVSAIVLGVLLLFFSVPHAVIVMTSAPIGEVILATIKETIHPPTAIDDKSVIENVFLEGKDKIVYDISLTVTSDEARKLSDDMKHEIRSQACQKQDFGYALKMGVSVEVRFRDIAGTNLEPILIRPVDCEQEEMRIKAGQAAGQ